MLRSQGRGAASAPIALTGVVAAVPVPRDQMLAPASQALDATVVGSTTGAVVQEQGSSYGDLSRLHT